MRTWRINMKIEVQRPDGTWQTRWDNNEMTFNGGGLQVTAFTEDGREGMTIARVTALDLPEARPGD